MKTKSFFISLSQLTKHKLWSREAVGLVGLNVWTPRSCSLLTNVLAIETMIPLRVERPIVRR